MKPRGSLGEEASSTGLRVAWPYLRATSSPAVTEAGGATTHCHARRGCTRRHDQNRVLSSCILNSFQIHTFLPLKKSVAQFCSWWAGGSLVLALRGRPG